MPITLPPETEKRLIAEIQHYFEKDRDEEIGALQASFFLRFVLEKIGPSIYNQAIRDAQGFLQQVVIDLDIHLHEPE